MSNGECIICHVDLHGTGYVNEEAHARVRDKKTIFTSKCVRVGCRIRSHNTGSGDLGNCGIRLRDALYERQVHGPRIIVDPQRLMAWVAAANNQNHTTQPPGAFTRHATTRDRLRWCDEQCQYRDIKLKERLTEKVADGERV